MLKPHDLFLHVSTKTKFFELKGFAILYFKKPTDQL